MFGDAKKRSAAPSDSCGSAGDCTYQGGGEDGEEDAEAEHDTVTGGLGEDGDAAEEAAR